MALTANKSFVKNINADSATFVNSSGEPRVNVEGVVEFSTSDLSATHLVDFDSQGADTSRYEIDMEGYKNLSIHWKLVTTNANDTTTMTVWGTNNSVADTSADTNWVDLSSLVLAAVSKSANNNTEEDMAFVDTSMNVLKYMIKVVTTTSGTNTNAGDVYIIKA